MPVEGEELDQDLTFTWEASSGEIEDVKFTIGYGLGSGSVIVNFHENPDDSSDTGTKVAYTLDKMVQDAYEQHVAENGDAGDQDD
jgi:hypothetical protein